MRRLKNKRPISKEVSMKIIKVESCWKCPYFNHNDRICSNKVLPIKDELYCGGFPSWCPLEEEIETDMKWKTGLSQKGLYENWKHLAATVIRKKDDTYSLRDYLIEKNERERKNWIKMAEAALKAAVQKIFAL